MTFVKHPGNPLIDVGAGGEWDAVHVFPATVLYRNHKWYLYYGAYDPSHIRAGLATSLDGITWTKHPSNPVLDVGAGGTWDDSYVHPLIVIYRNHKVYMYYGGHDGTYLRIGLATSLTGV